MCVCFFLFHDLRPFSFRFVSGARAEGELGKETGRIGMASSVGGVVCVCYFEKKMRAKV